MNSIFIVQSAASGVAMSFHSTQEGADEACAHEINACIDDGEMFDANNVEVAERRLEI